MLSSHGLATPLIRGFPWRSRANLLVSLIDVKDKRARKLFCIYEQFCTIVSITRDYASDLYRNVSSREDTFII